MPGPAPQDQPPSGTTLADSRAERPLRLLIAASLALPLAIFLIASWLSYNRHFVEAEDRLQRTVSTMHEHAIKVFETFEISARYLEELFNNVSDANILADEQDYSRRIANFIKTLPQLRDLWIINGKGNPLVSGSVYPMPHTLDLTDRDYFSVHLKSDIDTYISGVVAARAANTNFFAITRKRLGPGGAFNGVFLVSIAPEYFTRYYSELPRDDLNVAGLTRSDGVFLARYPSVTETFAKLPANSPLMSAAAVNPAGGIARGSSNYDTVDRVLAYRKLPGNEVYVYAAIDVAAIRASWMHAMATHLIFGIPATLAMFGLAILTLRHTRRESLAYTRLREETARRENTELALRQAQKMEAVGRLTGGIAHDFNNLLTAIIGNVELALRRNNAPDERVGRSLSAIRQASIRAATLVQRLLTFSRQHPQEVKTVDINRLVAEMSELLHRSIGEAVAVETVLSSGLWKTAIDPNQLENAILNLAVNGRDAMQNGGQLTIETSNAYLDEAYVTRAGGDLKAGQYVMIGISDTGIGMSNEVRDKAFEPFFTTKSAGAGSGLGLSMVYGFVKQSSGHVQIYSEIGHGTSIKMYFPRLMNESAFPAWETAETPKIVPRSEHHECILLVEDDDDVRGFVVEALTDIGYRVEHASTGAKGLELLQKFPEIALLFTDVILPGGMNGRELANEAVKIRPGLPVLFATGYTRNAIIHHGRLDANVELLTKPFTTENLARKVRQVIEGRSS